MFTSFSRQQFPDFGWVDFARDSRIQGWSSFDTNGRILVYKIVDNILYVIFRLDGTSNSSFTNFSIPINMTREFQIGATPSEAPSLQMVFSCSSTDNGTLNAGSVYVSENFSEGNRRGLYVSCAYGTIAGHSGSWTSTGVKRVRGQFFIPI
jgi:hypothetical protein